jgi:hypothetical protein
MGDSRYSKAADLVERIIGADAIKKASSFAPAFGNWNKIAGERLAAHSRVVDVKNGTVIIEADHPGWIQLLQADQGKILEKLIRLLPDFGIKAVTFRLRRSQGIAGTRELGSDLEMERHGCQETQADSETDPADVPSSEGIDAVKANPELSAIFDRFAQTMREDRKQPKKT